MSKIINKIISICLILALMLPTGIVIEPTTTKAAAGDTNTRNLQSSALLEDLMKEYTSFIVVKHKQLGNSDYAYTDSLTEYKDGDAPEREYSFYPGSQLILMTLAKQNNGTVNETETVLIDSPDGIIRDPDVSADGSKVVFSWKQNVNDDFHLYQMTLSNREVKQLTYGSGVADVEPCYTSDGSIIFESTRDQETIDCWVTEVFNLFKCDADGGNIIRIGYDQVATTGATACEDGRIIYTRWDYNDRSQMRVQAVFQMFYDGTMQTELYGNNSDWPTTLIHTREIPGASGKYISIISGHHVLQAGKVCIVDTNKGRNNKDAVNYIFPGEYNNKNDGVDTLGQDGPMYKYPYALNENEFWVSRAADGWGSNSRRAKYDICLMNTSGQSVTLVQGSNDLPASQMVPVKTSNLFQRASLVNYSNDFGTYYIGNVYEGEGMKGVKKGTAKYLRVVALDYRYAAVGATQGAGDGTSDPYSPIATGNGAWDIKRVLGIVPLEDDGSALFHCPSETPVYFQVLDKDGEMIQSMRSWSTLQPGEYFSCVGCHEDKNVAPPSISTPTKAMAKGVQELQPDLWMTGDEYKNWDAGKDSKGFDFEEVVQPILDNNCLACHNNTVEAKQQISYNQLATASTDEKETILDVGASWRYTTNNPGNNWYSGTFDASGWDRDVAPFGTNNTAPGTVGTVWNTQGDIYLKNSFNVNAYQLDNLDINIYLACTKNPEVYINGQLFEQRNGTISGYEKFGDTAKLKSMLREGANSIAVKATADTQKFIGLYIEGSAVTGGNVTLIEKGSQWKYEKRTDKRGGTDWTNVGFDDNSWATGQAPFGDRDGKKTEWTGGDTYIYIRKSFNLTKEQVYAYGSAEMYLNTFYDDNPVFYLNGHQIYAPPNWVDGFTTVKLGSEFSQYLKEGTNVLAIFCQNDTGGRQIDTSLYLDTSSVSSRTALVEQNAQWKFQKSGSAWGNTDWTQANYNDSGWGTSQAPFGDRYDKGISTDWGGDGQDHIYLRKTFTLTADQVSSFANAPMYIYTFYDDNPVFYLNGHQIAAKENWVDNYTTISLGTEASRYLQQGTNVFAVYCRNTTGGRMIEASLYLNAQGSNQIFAEKSGWKVLRNHTPDNAPSGWNQENFNDSGWENVSGGVNNYSMKYVFLRKQFNLSNDLANSLKRGQMKLYVSLFYDESPTIYINGHEALTMEGYNTKYTTYGLSSSVNQYLHSGNNTIAIVAHDTGGGQDIDCGLSARSIGAANKQFSLAGTGIYASRMKREYALSYLVLTQSYAANNGTEFMASSTNSITNWISSMSKAAVLDPYAYGSSKSNMISLLESGHGNLTEAELDAIRCWIDLGVPCHGDYYRYAKNWSTKEHKEFQVKWNKRLTNDMQDRYAKMARAGLLKNGQNLTVAFNGADGRNYSDTADTYVKLRVPQVYKQGDRVTVTLPQNQHYLAINLNGRLGESILYVPGNTYTYTIPSDYAANYDTRFDEYIDNVITARIPTNKELAATHNLASNVYDLTTGTTLISGNGASAKPNTNGTSAFPHAFTDSICRNGGEFAVRNAIDGTHVNNGHGTWPVQSWGPELGDHWMGVDFGHEVEVSGVTIYTRADFSNNLLNSNNDHDTYYTSAKVQFSDGSTQVVSMRKTADAQTYIFAQPVKTTYVKLMDMAVANRNNIDDWCGISEFEVMGHELVQTDEPGEVETPTDPPEESIIQDITTPAQVTTKENPSSDTTTKDNGDTSESQVIDTTKEPEATEPPTTNKTDPSIQEPYGLVVSNPKDNTIGVVWGIAQGEEDNFNIYIDGELVQENVPAAYYEFDGYAADIHKVEVARAVNGKESVKVGVDIEVKGSSEGKTTPQVTEPLTTTEPPTERDTEPQATTPRETEPQVTEPEGTGAQETPTTGSGTTTPSITDQPNTGETLPTTTYWNNTEPSSTTGQGTYNPGTGTQPTTRAGVTTNPNTTKETTTPYSMSGNSSVVKGLTVQELSGNKVTFTWTLDENQIVAGQSCNVYIDGQFYQSYVGPEVVSYEFADPGQHTIVIKASVNGQEEAEGITLNVNILEKETTTKTQEVTTTTPSYGDSNAAEALEKRILSLKNDNDPANATFSKLRARVTKSTKKSNKVVWKKQSGATKYVIYGAQCGTSYKKIVETTKTSYAHKKLKKGTYYKYMVVAQNDKGDVLAIARLIHAATKGGKVGNCSKLKVNKKKVTLKKGKKFKLKAKQIAKPKTLKIKKHRKVGFESSNTKVATVTKSGVIKAKKKGKCTIWVYAQNGMFTKIKITVK